MSNELKPCPFCGGEADLEHYTVGSWDDPEDRYDVNCLSCLASIESKSTEAEAIEAWNRRADVAKNATTPEVRTAKVIDKSVGRHSISDFDWIGKCEKCGNEIQYSFDFCPYCGVKLEWSE